MISEMAGLVGKTFMDPVRVFCPIPTPNIVHMRSKSDDLLIYYIILYISVYMVIPDRPPMVAAMLYWCLYVSHALS